MRLHVTSNEMRILLKDATPRAKVILQRGVELAKESLSEKQKAKMQNARTARTEITKNKIKKAVEKIKKEDRKITIRAIENCSGVAFVTIKKYIKEFI